MTIDDLFAMFAGKRSRKSVNTIQSKMPSLAPRQTQITGYFMPASSPKAKSSKSDVFTSSPSSTPDKPAPANHIARTPHYHMPAPKHPVRPSHTCRFCHETFRSNNGLHRHLRLIHLTPRLDQSSRDRPSALHGRNIGTNPLFFAGKRPSTNNPTPPYRPHGERPPDQ